MKVHELPHHVSLVEDLFLEGKDGSDNKREADTEEPARELSHLDNPEMRQQKLRCPR
jgi:hypothetical protein